MTAYALLNADEDSQPFWDAAADRRLVIPRCDDCGRWVWLPKPVCSNCYSASVSWVEAPQAGRVASWVVVHPPVVPLFQPLVPFVVVLVEVTDGVRLLGQLVDDAGNVIRTDGHDVPLAMGAPVSLRWCDQEGQLVPAWTLQP